MSPLLKTIDALVNYKCKTFINLTPACSFLNLLAGPLITINLVVVYLLIL